MTVVWAAAVLDTLRAQVAIDLDDEYTSRRLIAEQVTDRLRTISATFRAAAEQAGEDEDTEPYCAGCGEWIGMFRGLDGWQHFRGDPAPGGQRELYDPGHPAVPAWCVPPGRALSPAQVRVIGQALAEAITYQLHYLGGCAACGHDPAETYPDNTAGIDRASAYGELIAELAHALPQITGEGR
jgi:hypothetical protein